MQTNLIEAIDEMDHNWIWGSGLICAYVKDGSGSASSTEGSK